MSLLRLLKLAAIICLALPAATAVLPGCGGGGSSFNPVALLPAVPISFGNGQTGSLSLTQVSGTTVSGTLTVNPGAATGGAGTLPSLPAGSYPVSGTFTPPNGFLVSTVLPTVGTVSVSGHVPVGGAGGDYSVTAGGQTFNGTLP